MKKILIAALLGAMAATLVAALATSRQADPVYLLAQIDIHDRDTYRLYESEFGPILVRHGGEVVGFSESPRVLEGQWDYGRTVVLRFASEESAMAWYNDAEYQRIAKHRWAASKGNVALIAGR